MAGAGAGRQLGHGLYPTHRMVPVLALVGGFDFNQSKFNRATRRCVRLVPISNRSSTRRRWIKANPCQHPNDVPISRWDAGAGSDWQPKNSPAEYAGYSSSSGLGQSKTW